MFNNLIESSSHAGEFKRRGSFVLVTTATYLLLMIGAGVASIYAYDAQLGDQNTEFEITMLNPVDLPAPPVAPKTTAPPPRGHNDAPTAVREVAMANVNRPEIVPDKPSAVASTHLPVPEHGDYIIGARDSNPIAPSGTARVGTGSPGDSSDGQPSVDIGTPPPAQPPIKRSPPAIVSKGVITGLAKLLPKPSYPPIARQARAHGPVSVQVLIDENGKVISAKAVSGHPLLLAAAQQAAYQARFSPTRLSDEPVKVSGVITYNFVLQ